MQSSTYPTEDSSSYIDESANGFRDHSWSSEQYATKNYTDGSSYVKNMPKGYELDLSKAYSVPVSKGANKKANKTSAGNATSDANETAAANETAEANVTSEANETAEANATSEANGTSEANATAGANETEGANATSSANATKGAAANATKKAKKPKSNVKELNETQIQHRYETTMDDTYEKDNSFAQKGRLSAPDLAHGQHGE